MQKATTGDAWGVAVTLTLVVVSACGGSGTVTPAAGPGGTASATSGHEAPAATAGAPATPVHQAALPEDSTARRGHALFDAACARCHATSVPLADLGYSPERMDAVLHAGSERGGLMPAVPPSALPEAELPALVAYLRTLHAVR